MRESTPSEGPFEARSSTSALILGGSGTLLLLQTASLIVLGTWGAPQWFHLMVILLGSALAFGLGLWLFRRWGLYFALVGCAAVGLCVPGSMKLYPLLGPAAVDIRVEEVAAHAGARQFGFADAEPLPSAGDASRIDTTTRHMFISHSYHVVPIVGAAWQRPEPVRVWAVSRLPLGSDELAQMRAGFRVRLEELQYLSAVRASASRNDLALDPAPLLLDVGSSLEELRESALVGLLGVLLVPLLLWVPAVALVRGVQLGTGDFAEPEAMGSDRDFAVSAEGEWQTVEQIDPSLQRWLSGKERVPANANYHPVGSRAQTVSALVLAWLLQLGSLTLWALTLYWGYRTFERGGPGLKAGAFLVGGLFLTFLAFRYFPAAIREERQSLRRQKSGQWRDGLYLLSSHLLYHLNGQAFFLARASVKSVHRSPTTKSEPGRLRLDYEVSDQVGSLEVGQDLEAASIDRLHRDLEVWAAPG